MTRLHTVGSLHASGVPELEEEVALEVVAEEEVAAFEVVAAPVVEVT